MTEWTFGSRKQVVLLGDPAEFRRLETPDGSEAFLHGSPLGIPQAGCDPEGLAEAFGGWILLVHDPRASTLAIHTDRFGTAPFFHAFSDDRLYLSTRIKPLIERGTVSGALDASCLSDLLAFHRSLGTKTLLSGVAAFDAATRASIDLEKPSLRASRSWHVESLLREERVPFARARDELVSRFLAAVEECVQGVAEPAVTLSGGLDTRCLMAALSRLGRSASAYHVSVPGSRAERYSRQIAETCGVPFHGYRLDEDFSRHYGQLLERVARSADGMKFAPQAEMLWLRDQVPEGSVVLHGAFGELSKLEVLRDYRIDESVLAADRGSLADLLWRRYATGFSANLDIFSADFRREIEGRARANLDRKLAEIAPDLRVPDVLQVCYFDEFLRSTRYGHRLWNERVRARFPFLHPRYVDALLRVRTEDRLHPDFQIHFLERVHPRLNALPDENTGTRVDASALHRLVVRAADLARLALFDSKVDVGHGDLVGWLSRMEPAPEAFVSECRASGLYDADRLLGMISAIREHGRRARPLRGLSRRRAQREAQALQTFFMVELSRRWLGWTG